MPTLTVGDRSAPHADFTADVVAGLPYAALADALRARIARIIAAWTLEVRASVAAANRLPFDELADDVPRILSTLADALGSDDPAARRAMVARAPRRGITRFQQHYEPRDLADEDRLLRRHVVRQVEAELDRSMTTDEQAALNMGLDLTAQQATAAFIDRQSAQLRDAAESELRYLSFLSHDLSNNLNGVTLWLKVLRNALAERPDGAADLRTVDAVEQMIVTTLAGMGRLLQAERLRHAHDAADPQLCELRTLIANQTRLVEERARQRGVRIVIEVPAEATVRIEPDLLALVLQNLLHNAMKFASPGAVRVRAERQDAGRGRARWAVSVIDEGPGIPPEQVGRIFSAFARGTMEGAEAGVGLGLAIASRAAALLGGQLTVDSTPGVGSTFTLALPVA